MIGLGLELKISKKKLDSQETLDSQLINITAALQCGATASSAWTVCLIWPLACWLVGCALGPLRGRPLSQLSTGILKPNMSAHMTTEEVITDVVLLGHPEKQGPVLTPLHKIIPLYGLNDPYTPFPPMLRDSPLDQSHVWLIAVLTMTWFLESCSVSGLPPALGKMIRLRNASLRLLVWICFYIQ